MLKKLKFISNIFNIGDMYSGVTDNKSVTRFHRPPLFVLLSLLIFCIILELTLFNFRYYMPMLDGAALSTVVTPNNFTEIKGGQVVDGVLVIDGKGSFVINSLKTRVFGFGINFKNQIDSVELSVRYSDESNSVSYIGAQPFELDTILNVKKAKPGSNQLTLADNFVSDKTLDTTVFQLTNYNKQANHIVLVTSGSIKKLELTFEESYGNKIYISGINVNKPPFNFSLFRIILLFAIFSCIFAIMRYKLWTKPFTSWPKWQTVVFYTIVLTAILIPICIVIYCMIVAPDSVNSAPRDIYAKFTDALLKGQFHLLENPPAKLAELANPYDTSIRVREGIDALWDSAYYDGKYYVYFGIAPAILLLLPYRIITGFDMPTYISCTIFTVTIITSCSFIYNKLMIKWFPKANSLIYLFGLITVLFGMNIYWSMTRPWYYELAQLSALAFMLLAYAMIFAAIDKQKPFKYLALCSLFVGLSLASRPTILFFLIPLLPIAASIIFKSSNPTKLKTYLSICTCIPLGIISCLLMAYNYIRFDSIFEFGARFQLTVCDVNYYRFDFSRLIEAIYHYLLQPLTVDLRFPFFHIQRIEPTDTIIRYYNGPASGLFNLPFMYIVLGIAPLLRRMNGNEQRLKKHFTFLLIISAFLVMVINFMYGGVIQRYSCDFTIFVGFAAIILINQLISRFSSASHIKVITLIYCSICAVTCIISLAICIIGENGLVTLDNTLYYDLMRMFEFWN